MKEADAKERMVEEAKKEQARANEAQEVWRPYRRCMGDAPRL